MNARVVAAVDAACVVLFVVLGRRSHDEGNLLWGTVTTAAPFLAGLAAGWVAGWRLRWEPRSLRFGGLVWASTLVLGMVLRHLFGRGTAATFIVVAAVFLGLFLLGWRIVAALVAGRRRDVPAAGH